MRTFAFFATLICSLVIAGAQESSRWFTLVEEPHRTIRIDLKGQTQTTRGLSVWTWVVFADTRSLASNGKSYRSAMYRESFDCQDRKSALLATRHFSDANARNLIDEHEVRAPDFRLVTPGSTGEAILDLVCQGK